MTTQEPMSDERLDEIESLFWYKRADGSDDAAKEVIAAYRRLRAELAASRAENERLRAALLEFTEPNAWGALRYCYMHDMETNTYHCLASGKQPRTQGEHAGDCPVRIAWDALHPAANE